MLIDCLGVGVMIKPNSELKAYRIDRVGGYARPRIMFISWECAYRAGRLILEKRAAA